MQKKLKFEVKGQRVKGLHFHATKPWIISSLHNGSVQIWDFNMKIMSFDVAQVPTRGACFHSQLPLFATGSDDAMVRVWDYKQKRCLFVLKGHIDYVRTVYFHSQLPWLLSASDDQTMRIWNYQSRLCVNIITGHCHYVMCAQFHPSKSLIVSASLDATIRLWDYTVLRKKMTDSKNLSTFAGIEIECIKILDGHQRGCNWATFHPTQNFIASSSDDHKIKLWKYTNEVAWEHSSIPAHKNNVSCVIFDSNTGLLISNSEDRHIKIWNVETKAQVFDHVAESRYWILNINPVGTLLAAGHDNGFEIFQLNKKVVPSAILGDSIGMFAKGMKTFITNLDPKNPSIKEELYQYKANSINALVHINRIVANPFNQKMFYIEVMENSVKTIVVKKKESYLQYPLVHGPVYTNVLDACFDSEQTLAFLQTPNIICALKNKINFPQPIHRIFAFAKGVILVAAQSKCFIYGLAQQKIYASFQLPSSCIIIGIAHEGNRVVLYSKNTLFLLNDRLQLICTVLQKYSIKSVVWQTPQVILYSTKIQLKFSLINGETGVLKSTTNCLNILKKIDQQNFLSFSVQKSIIETIKLEDEQQEQLQFKLAVMHKDWGKVREIFSKNESKKSLINYLIKHGEAGIALTMVNTPEQKFALAVQSTTFELALEVCNQINSEKYWKMLGEEALKQGVFQAYQLAYQKLKLYDRLTFLYSLQANDAKLQRMIKLANKVHNPILAFNAALFINEQTTQEQILRENGLSALAQLAQEVARGNISDRLKFLGTEKLNVLRPKSEPDFSNWLLNLPDADQNDQN